MSSSSRRILAIVLGGGMHPDGSPVSATVARAEAAARLAADRPDIELFILSGARANTDDKTHTQTEAEAMLDIMVAAGVDPTRLRLEQESRDTMGNAVLTAIRYLSGSPGGILYVVTSPFHVERATIIFRGVAGNAWQVEGYESLTVPEDYARALNEAGGIDFARRFFAGLPEGNLQALSERLIERYPHYTNLPTLHV